MAGPKRAGQTIEDVSRSPTNKAERTTEAWLHLLPVSLAALHRRERMVASTTGPTVRRRKAGRMRKTRGKSILTGARLARSSARVRRSPRRSSATVRSAPVTDVPSLWVREREARTRRREGSARWSTTCWKAHRNPDASRWDPAVWRRPCGSGRRALRQVARGARRALDPRGNRPAGRAGSVAPVGRLARLPARCAGHGGGRSRAGCPLRELVQDLDELARR